MSNILAIDPGMTTGLAYKLGDEVYYTNTIKSELDQLPLEVWDEIDPETIDIVVFERFQAQTISKYGLYTLRIIGGIQALCYKFNIPCFQQTPSQRKIYIKPAAWYIKKTKGSSFLDHEKDALAQLLRYEESKTPGKVQLMKDYLRATNGRR